MIRDWSGGIVAKCDVRGCRKTLGLMEVNRYLNEHAPLKTEIEALREYATHKPGCHENGEKCICGLDALLTSQEEPTKR